MLDLEVAQTPDVSPLHECEEMQTSDGLTVPVEIWKEEEAGVGVPVGAEDHVFLFGAAVEDVEDPVEAAGGALAGYVGWMCWA